MDNQTSIGRVSIFVLTALLMLSTSAIRAQASEPSSQSKTIEQRLIELEQKQKQLEDQLEAERAKAASFADALAQTRTELEQLKSGTVAPASGSAIAAAAAASPAIAEAQKTQIEAIVDQRLETKKSEIAAPAWVRNMEFFGDFRYRYEWTDDESKTEDRDRNRIQTRVGFRSIVNEEMNFGFRLASANNEAPIDEGSPTSRNQDLTDAFSAKNIWIDWAYFDYHPAGIKGLNVYGGKFENPYYRVGNSDLMFDNDIAPEGIAGVYKTKLSETVELFGVAGGYSIKERETDADASLWAVQGGATVRFGPEKVNAFTAGAGYYDYGNVQGRQGLGKDPTQFYGNTSTGGVFASDFDLLQGFADLAVSVAGVPVRIFGETIDNLSAESDEDTAWLAGAGIGKTTSPGTWAFVYNYRDLEADSLLGIFTDASFGGGGTNTKGHKFTFQYQLAKNTQLGLTYMDADRTRSGETTDYDTLFADLVIKF
ncbi:MAG: putative porin [Planctomycetaceae bacterium]|nr:putative porin [Planctomycetaceae bacterium]